MLFRSGGNSLNRALVFTGSIWSLAGAMFYAVYIVMIKRKVDREDKLDIPMFFGKYMFNLLGYLLDIINP